MGNKKVENNKGNDKNITIRLKKLTGTKIDAAKKNCSKKVDLASKRVTRSNSVALGIDIQTEFNDALRTIDTPKRKKSSEISKLNKVNGRIVPIVSNAQVNHEESPKQILPTTSKRTLVPLDRNEALKKRRLTDNNDVAAQTDGHTIDSVAATISSPLVEDTTVAKIDFSINEVVWAKIRGYPAWPAKIKSFPNLKTAIVVWFNDYRTTKIYKTQLFKFLPFFDRNSVNFDKTIGLKKAAQEGLIYYGNMMST